MTNNHISFENPEDRGRCSRMLRELFEQNNLSNWWVCASPIKPEILIQPKEYKEWMWESLPIVSRISIQINGDGKPSFGVSGYDAFKIPITQERFKDRGYDFKVHIDKRGKVGRWWLTKRFDNLETIVGEMKDIEPFLYEKDYLIGGFKKIESFSYYN